MFSTNAVITGSYAYGEVARSIVIAIAASYAARAMHFKAMLALHLPLPVEYHWPTVLASFVVAVFTSAVALSLVSRRQGMSLVWVWLGGLVMGGGIIAMHFVGMASMRFRAFTRFDSLFVALSIALAIGFSSIALLIVFRPRKDSKWTPLRTLSGALIMGAAISATHYTVMAAVSLVPSAIAPNLSRTVSVSPLGSNGILIVTFLVLGAAIWTSSADRQTQTKISQLNESLEHRVVERTAQLEVVVRALRKEISERARAEVELRESEARFRLVADSAPVMIWMSGTDKLCIYFNKSWLDFTGRSSDSQLGNGWTEGLAPEDLQRCLDTYIQSFDRQEAFTMEYRLRRHDGEFRWVLDIGVPRFNPDGSFAGYIGSCIDVTEHRQAEEQSLQAQEDLALMTRLVAMGGLSAAIAHEVNQPLSAIVINANFCVRQIASGSPHLGNLGEALVEIANDAERTSAVICRIRALFRKGSPERVALDINQIIGEVAILLRNELMRSRVSLRTDLAPQSPSVFGDSVQLQQVLINLVMNGIDAMRSITDRPRELLIKTAKIHDEVSIQVQDSGTGFDQQQAKQIFEPFFTTKRRV